VAGSGRDSDSEPRSRRRGEVGAFSLDSQYSQQQSRRAAYDMLLLLLLAGGAAAAPADSKPEAFAGGVLVTGAGGKTGSLIYKQLKAQGVKDLRASVYSLDKARSALGCTKCDASEGIFVGDVTKPETLAESFRGVKTVLCAVGASPGMNATLQQAVEFTGVENQIAALTAGNPGVEPTELTFVLCSSMGTTDPTPKPYEGGPILFWKLNAEAFLGSCGVTAVVVKPGGLLDGPQGKSTLVVGHDDKLLASVSPPTVTRADVAAVMVAAAAERSNLRFGLVSKPGPPGDMHALLQSARWPWDRRGQQHEL
jgi:uncharacterized protein YbjT (DUF2867 family)